MRRPSLETDRQRRFSASSNSAASTRGSRRSSTTDDGVATRRRPSLDNKSLKLSTCARVAPPESTTPAPKAARFGDDVATAAPSAATLAGMPGGSASFRRRSTLQGRAGAAEGPSEGSRRLSMSAALSSLLLPVNEKPPAPPLRSPSKGASPRTPIARQSTGVLKLGDGRKVSVTNSKAKDGDDE